MISEDDRMAPLAIADHLAADGPRGHGGVPDARSVAARRQVHDRRGDGPARRGRRDNGPDDAARRRSRTWHVDGGPLLQRAALDDRRRGLGGAGLRIRPRRRAATTRCVPFTPPSTCSATPSLPAAWSSPRARPTSSPARSIDTHPSVRARPSVRPRENRGPALGCGRTLGWTTRAPGRTCRRDPGGPGRGG